MDALSCCWYKPEFPSITVTEISDTQTPTHWHELNGDILYDLDSFTSEQFAAVAGGRPEWFPPVGVSLEFDDAWTVLQSAVAGLLNPYPIYGQLRSHSLPMEPIGTVPYPKYLFGNKFANSTVLVDLFVAVAPDYWFRYDNFFNPAEKLGEWEFVYYDNLVTTQQIQQSSEYYNRFRTWVQNWAPPNPRPDDVPESPSEDNVDIQHYQVLLPRAFVPGTNNGIQLVLFSDQYHRILLEVDLCVVRAGDSSQEVSGGTYFAPMYLAQRTDWLAAHLFDSNQLAQGWLYDQLRGDYANLDENIPQGLLIPYRDEKFGDWWTRLLLAGFDYKFQIRINGEPFYADWFDPSATCQLLGALRSAWQPYHVYGTVTDIARVGLSPSEIQGKRSLEEY